MVGISKDDLRKVRRDVSFVFQDPGSSLNPRLPVGESIGEPLLLPKVAKGEELSRACRGSARPGAPRPATCATATRTSSRAGSASGSASPGRWRSSPRLLIADEPTSALDVSVQARVLDLFQELQREIGFACLFISHDLAVVEILAQRIAVMQNGRLVEFGHAGADPHRSAGALHPAAARCRAGAGSRGAARRRTERDALLAGLRGRDRAVGGEGPQGRRLAMGARRPTSRNTRSGAVRSGTAMFGAPHRSGRTMWGMCCGRRSMEPARASVAGSRSRRACTTPSHSSHEEDHHVSNMRRTKRLVALAAGLSLVAAACGGDDDDDTDATAAPEATEAARSHRGSGRDRGASRHREPRRATDGHRGRGTKRRAGGARDDGHHRHQPRRGVGRRDADHVRRLRVHVAGQPEHARLDRDGRLRQDHLDRPRATATSRSSSSSARSYAPYKDLFRSMHQGRRRRRTARTSRPTSADGAAVLGACRTRSSRGASTSRCSCPTRTTRARTPPTAERVVMVPKADQDTEVASLLSGESRLHLPAGVRRHHRRPRRSRTSRYTPGYGTNYEGLYFQQFEGPFADDDFRTAFAKSIDRSLILANDLRPDLPGRPAAQLRPVGPDDRPVVRPDGVRQRGRHRRVLRPGRRRGRS